MPLFRCALFCVKWIPKNVEENGKNPASSWKFWYKVLVLINDVCAVLWSSAPQEAKSAIIKCLFNELSISFVSFISSSDKPAKGRRKTAYNFHGKVDLSSSQIVPLISRPRNIPWFLDGSLQAFEAEKFTLEAEKFQKKLPSVKPTLTGVYRISLNSGDLLNMDVSNTRSLGMVINCSLPTVSSYFKSCFSSFPPLSSRHSGDFSRFFVFFGCFNLLKHGWRTDSKMSGGISQPAARIMLPTSSLRSIHQVVAYYAFSPNFLVKVQRKLKKNMFKHVLCKKIKLPFL